MTSLSSGQEPIPGYRLSKLLGRGGVGEVWQAEAPGGVTKAIKINFLDQSTEVLTKREVAGLQVMRAIRHPYLLAIDRFELNKDMLVIVTEMADGSLADRFQDCVKEGNNGIPRDELLRHLAEASEVLDMLSDKHGLQHLDVKPNNLLLLHGHVKVADFGLVQPGRSNVDGFMMAFTPEYAGPELYEGRIEDSSDQYSLAVTYQEMLTGTLPFRPGSAVEMLMQLAEGSPDLSPLPEADRPLVAKAMAPSPNDRFRSCTEFVEALKAAKSNFFAGEKTTESKPTLKAHHRAPSDTPANTGITPTVPSNPPGLAPKKVGKSLFVKHRTNLPDAPAAAKSSTPGTRADGKQAPSGPHQKNSTRLLGQSNKESSETSRGLQVTFLASLPTEIFAIKLRAFIDAVDAEVLDCTEKRTELFLRPSSKGSWFGFQNKQQGVQMSIETAQSSGSHVDNRVVQVEMQNKSRKIPHGEFTRRANVIVRALKAFFMATDDDRFSVVDPDILRANIWGNEKP